MRIKFYIDSVDSELKYPTAESDLYAAGLDCIQGLLLELNPPSKEIFLNLESSLKNDEFEWWGESTRVVGKGNDIKIYTPNSYNDEHALIKKEQLKSILADWKLFLKDSNALEKKY